jgi:phage terminase small subunit
VSKLSEQQEKFCRNIIEGLNQTDAYKMAGYKCANDNVAAANASELIRNPKIVAFIDEHREKASERAEMTLQRLIDMAEHIYTAAVSDEAYGPAVSALKELGVLTGLRVEKRRNENINRNVEDLSDAELEAILAEGSSSRAAESQDSPQESDSVH